MTDGRTVEGSHALMTHRLGAQHRGLGLERVGIELEPGDYIPVDRVSRTPAAGIYAAGDCTGLLPLASVAAMQGRIAMYHALGEGVIADPAAHGGLGDVHPAGDRRGGRPAVRDRRRQRARPHADAAAEHQRQGQDVAAAARLRQDLLPARPRAW